ncbi:hypothetical protein BJV77DRAFT_972380 [Russula vinacea]|nr:hypothetical protein BJV77DRAFT_972380 [Russula vinacea]
MVHACRYSRIPFGRSRITTGFNLLLIAMVTSCDLICNVTRHALRWASPACVKIRQGFSCIDRPADWRLDLPGAQIASSRLRFETTMVP